MPRDSSTRVRRPLSNKVVLLILIVVFIWGWISVSILLHWLFGAAS